MTIAIVVEDRIKTPGIQDGIDYYQKLCSGWLTVNVEPMRDLFKTSKKRSAFHGQAIVSMLKPTDFLAVLDRQRSNGGGWAPDSQEFASFIDQIMRGSWHRVLFAVGGPEGLGQEIFERADRVLSLSALTFPHDLVPLILMEQLYRSLTILHRHPYHR
jgi:23S rRNA (pseudouridine1915-N3)-methyltransferase